VKSDEADPAIDFDEGLQPIASNLLSDDYKKALQIVS